jgi:hypothetical protein
MKSKNFIEKELKNFTDSFPEFRLRYEYDEDYYCIEISPGNIYFQNTEFLKWGCNLRSKFVNLFPEEGICFISDEDEFPLEKIDFTVCGERYVPKKGKQKKHEYETV